MSKEQVLDYLREQAAKQTPFYRVLREIKEGKDWRGVRRFDPDDVVEAMGEANSLREFYLSLGGPDTQYRIVSRDELSRLITQGILDEGSSRGEEALIGPDIEGRLCVCGIGSKGSLRIPEKK